MNTSRRSCMYASVRCFFSSKERPRFDMAAGGRATAAQEEESGGRRATGRRAAVHGGRQEGFRKQCCVCAFRCLFVRCRCMWSLCDDGEAKAERRWRESDGATSVSDSNRKKPKLRIHPAALRSIHIHIIALRLHSAHPTHSSATIHLRCHELNPPRQTHHQRCSRSNHRFASACCCCCCRSSTAEPLPHAPLLHSTLLFDEYTTPSGIHSTCTTAATSHRPK